MGKTTVYLPAELKAALKRTAATRGTSEAEVIRAAIEAAVRPARPRPRGGLFPAMTSSPLGTRCRRGDRRARRTGARCVGAR